MAGGKSPAQGSELFAGERLHVRLKAATGRHHAQIERCIRVDSIGKSPSSYCEVLARIYGFMQPLEACLCRLPLAEWGFDYAPRQKTPRLVSDLRHFHWSSTRLNELPRATDFPYPAQRCEAVGVLYVVEGSMLGGRLILRLLQQSLAVSALKGAAYFGGYGDDTGPMWREFQNWADASADSEQGARSAIRFARRTFLTFERWLSNGENKL